MANLEFSVPYNNDPETLTKIFNLKSLNGNHIREVYLSGPQQYSGSGRITEEFCFWQPWVKGYQGELTVGAYFYQFPKYVWIDQELKKAMGH